LRTFDHYGTLGCAHVLYPPVIPIGSWACLVVKACDDRLTAMWCFEIAHTASLLRSQRNHIVASTRANHSHVH
jgi:hypothetical protein